MRTNCFSPARSFLILSLLWVVVFGSSNAVAGTVVAHWIGGSGNWSSSANWDIGKVPNNSGGTNYDVVVNVPAANATILIDQSVTINSLSNAETVVIASGTNAISQWTINSGSIQMTGAVAQLTLSGSINNPGQITATTGTLYLISATLTCTNATSRVTANCVGSLTDVSLNASGGGVIEFPGATNYVDTGYGQALQASGPGSRIDLSHLLTFDGGNYSATQIKALAGGEVDLGGVVSGSTAWTLQDPGSLFNVTNVTALGGASLSVSNGLALTFPQLITLTDVDLWAWGGGVIAFPAATSYVDTGYGQTLQASGAGSRIDLSHLLTFVGGNYSATQIKALNGDLDGAVADADAVTGDQPHSGQAWLLRAQLAGRQGDRPEAIRALQRTIAEDAEDPQLYLFLGELLVAEGRTNEAVGAYEKCLQFWNGPPKAREQIEADLAKLRKPVKK